MYAYIKGKISEVNPTNIVVDNNGIGYEVVVANPYEYHLNEERTVFISQQVREDSNVLYGFSNKEQKKKMPKKKDEMEVLAEKLHKETLKMHKIRTVTLKILIILR